MKSVFEHIKKKPLQKMWPNSHSVKADKRDSKVKVNGKNTLFLQ